MSDSIFHKSDTAAPLKGKKGRTGLHFVPFAITSTRLSVFPFLVLSLANELSLVADLLFLIAISSDFADGYLARRLGASSDFGAIFDATVDFIFIGGMFLHFTLTGSYPLWAFLLVIFMFVQFAATSVIFKRVFDPIGKYYGSLLYGAIGLTILFSNDSIVSVVTTALLVVSITCLASRIIFLKIRAQNKQ